MINNDLINYVNQQRKQGLSDEQITINLRQVGWSEQDIQLGLGQGSPSTINIPNLTPKSSSFSKKILLLLGIPILIFGVGASSFLIYRNYQTKNSQTKDTDISQPKTTPQQEEKVPASIHPVIAFTKGSQVILFDTVKGQELPVPLEFVTKQGTYYKLGPWSPTGKYLPVLSTSGISEQAVFSLYLYDVTQDSVKQIRQEQGVSNSLYLMEGTFSFASRWFNENELVLGTGGGYGQVVGTIITTEGELKQVPSTNKLYIKNDIIDFYRTTDLSAIENVRINGQTLSFIPKGTIVAFTNNYLVTLEEPKAINILEEMKKGLTEEELKKKQEEALNPTGEANLLLYDIKTSEIRQTISLTESPWHVKDVQLIPKTSFLLVHQWDDFLRPKNERFLKIDLTGARQREILFPKTINGSVDGTLRLSLERGKSFLLTDDGKWLITYKERFPSAMDGGIIIRNLDTKTEKEICTGNCQDLWVYNPSNLQSGYAF